MANQRYETQLFQEQLRDIRQRDKQAGHQIDRVLERIVSNPELNDGQVKGPLSGHFKKKAVGRKYRIIFQYCQWCMKAKNEKCAGCEEREDESVILQEVFLRRDGYD